MFVLTTIPPAVHAASIGIPDTLLLMLLALMVFGPRRLPEIGRQIGKLMYEFRKISNDFKFQMEEELRLSEEADRQRLLAAAQPAHTPPPAPVFSAAAPETTAPAQETAAPAPTEFAPAEAISPAAPASDPAAVDSVTSAFPTIHPPTNGSVVPRAFRGLVPPPAAPDAAPESAATLASAAPPEPPQTDLTGTATTSTAPHSTESNG